MARYTFGKNAIKGVLMVHLHVTTAITPLAQSLGGKLTMLTYMSIWKAPNTHLYMYS